jgi:hypothetical protein
VTGNGSVQRFQLPQLAEASASGIPGIGASIILPSVVTSIAITTHVLPEAERGIFYFYGKPGQKRLSKKRQLG